MWLKQCTQIIRNKVLLSFESSVSSTGKTSPAENDVVIRAIDPCVLALYPNTSLCLLYPQTPLTINVHTSHLHIVIILLQHSEQSFVIVTGVSCSCDHLPCCRTHAYAQTIHLVSCMPPSWITGCFL